MRVERVKGVWGAVPPDETNIEHFPALWGFGGHFAQLAY